jgi:hypothetical protein
MHTQRALDGPNLKYRPLKLIEEIVREYLLVWKNTDKNKMYIIRLTLLFFFFLVVVVLEFKLRTLHCKASTLPLEPHLQSILVWLFWRWCFVNCLLGWSQTVILQISASQVVRITDMSHWHQSNFDLIV